MYDVNIIDEYFFAFELGKVKVNRSIRYFIELNDFYFNIYKKKRDYGFFSIGKKIFNINDLIRIYCV